VGFVKTLTNEVDPERIGLWGSSYSGGNVIIASAVDHRVKAVVSQVPFTSGEEYTEVIKGIRDYMYTNRTHGVASEYIPLFCSSLEEVHSDSQPRPILHAEDAYEYSLKAAERAKAGGAKWENKISVQTMYHMLKNEPVQYIHRIAPRPLLIVVGLKDSVLSPEGQIAAFKKAGEGAELAEFDIGHFDAYIGEGFKRNVARQLEFWKKHL
jgi:uncharacterized protein